MIEYNSFLDNFNNTHATAMNTQNFSHTGFSTTTKLFHVSKHLMRETIKPSDDDETIQSPSRMIPQNDGLK